MELTHEEKEMLGGKFGEAVQKSMEILVALGKIFGADRLLDVKSVQVAGVSYHNLGDAGLEYLEGLARSGKVKPGVNATLNPAGMDLKMWESHGIAPEFAQKQKKVINAFQNLGINITCTCTPYFIGNKPEFGEHIAWSESSAVAYANSVLGARTNREGGPSSIASALTGKTPNYGLHLDENRKSQLTVNVNPEVSLSSASDFGALAYAIARKAKNKVLYIKGVKSATTEQLKSFCASSATYGATALFHIENITPEWEFAGVAKDCIEISKEDMDDAYGFLNDECEVDFVSVGCPHCSADELSAIAELLDGKSVTKETWILTSRGAYDNPESRDSISTIEKSGAKVVCDTCMAVAPLKGRFKCLATNSAKACFYGRGSNDFKTRFLTLEECINEALR